MSIQKYIRRAARNTATRSLSNEHLSLILSSAKEDPNLQDLVDVVTIISNTGIRAQELIELRWSDVDVEKRDLVVNSKKSASTHRVHLGAKVFQILEARHKLHRESKYVLGKSPQLTLYRVLRQLCSLSASIGIAPISPHDLRQAFLRARLNLERPSNRSRKLADEHRLSSGAFKRALIQD